MNGFFYTFVPVMSNKLRVLLFSLLLCCCCTAWGDDAIIEHQGDHYVINIDAMNPDSEMTLFDVLQLCPELTLVTGMALNDNYTLCVDDVDLFVDNETFLRMVKAREVESIDVYMNPSVSQGVGGSEAVININYRKADKDGTTGKVALEGSTYGNGLLYADAKAQKGNFSVRGYALGDLYYSKGTPIEGGLLRKRQTTQNAHITTDWDISSVDNLKVKFFQLFTDYKERYYNTDEPYKVPAFERLASLSATYTHTLNDKDATIQTEAGSAYISSSETGITTRQTTPYFFAELNTPLIGDDLWMMLGWEINYENIWIKDLNRQQYLKNDFYMQLDYSHGPWIATLGSRHTLLNYWDHFHTGELSKRWSHHRNSTTVLASAGYKWGRHYIQGTFNRDFYIPSFDDFYENVMGVAKYSTRYRTNLVWRGELRYTYQQPNLAFFGTVTHTWKTDMPTPREDITGVRTSLTWHKGALRLTAGASYYHQRIAAGEEEPVHYDNYYTLKLAPTLLLGKGFRLSSTMLFKSREKYAGIHSHLYASVKVNKDLGRHCNIYADFHDLAGMPTFSIDNAAEQYNNRALTLGITYRF